MKVKGAQLTAWIGASGMRERRPVAVDFIIKRGTLHLANLPMEALQLLWHHHGITPPMNMRRLRGRSALRKALALVEVDITRGLSEEYHPSSPSSNERQLRVGSRVELYTTLDEQQHHILKGFVTKVETVVFLR